jgi:hypothetical protein
MPKVKGIAKLFPRDEDAEVPILALFVDHLSCKVHAVTADDESLVFKVTIHLEENNSIFTGYVLFSTAESPHDRHSIKYSKSSIGLGPVLI